MDEESGDQISSQHAIRRAVERACRDHFFLGWALSRYQAINGLDDPALADWLECTSTQLDRLALCKLPSDESDRFGADVRQIAEFGQCRPEQLMKLLRQVAAVSSLGGVGDTKESATLIAARDRKTPADESQEPK